MAPPTSWGHEIIATFVRETIPTKRAMIGIVVLQFIKDCLPGNQSHLQPYQMNLMLIVTVLCVIGFLMRKEPIDSI